MKREKVLIYILSICLVGVFLSPIACLAIADVVSRYMLLDASFEERDLQVVIVIIDFIGVCTGFWLMSLLGWFVLFPSVAFAFGGLLFLFLLDHTEKINEV